MVKARGRLDVVATPIGNLSDLSPRARDALASADLIAAEDTRHTAALLHAMGISRPMLSLHDHNEKGRVPEILGRLDEGANVALVSDAGTPLLSDPGYELVREASERGIDVRAIPGPSAITAALAVAGLPTDRFCFEGFLPAKDSERRTRLATLAREPRTLVFFESPHRIQATLRDLVAAFGHDRRAVVARELTKVYETVYRGGLAQLVDQAERDANFARGEITMIVAGAVEVEPAAEAPTLERVVSLLVKELPPGRAAALAAQLTNGRRSDAYAIALRLTGSQEPDK